MEREAVIWAAGLFEGEGSVGLCSPASRGKRPTLNLTSTDRDVLDRFQLSVGGLGRIYGPYDQGHKPFWKWQAYTYETVQAILAALWPWLCERRRRRATEVLLTCRHYVPQKRYVNRTCDVDGCERKHAARGLCHLHYDRTYRSPRIAR